MKLMRFIAGLIAFVAVWLMVGLVGLLAMPLAFPSLEARLLGVRWATIPGSILGVWLGYSVYQRVSGDRPGRTLQ